MGFRMRKSIGGKNFRINFSKSGVGYSFGTKGMRFTKKASGGYRQTISIPGSGMSYVKDYEKNENSHVCCTETISYTVPMNEGASREQSFDYPIRKDFIQILFLFALWPLFFIPIVIGASKLDEFCNKINWYRNECYKTCKIQNFEILNENSSNNISQIAFLSCLWFLVFPLFIVPEKTRVLLYELEELEDIYQKKCEEEKISDIEFRTRLQNILYPGHKIEVLLSKNHLLLEVKWAIENSERIIKDCKQIVESTTNIDTFFSRFNLLAEKYQGLIPYEGLIEFQGYTPTKAYNGIIAQKDSETELFVSRYIACMVDSAASLKTDRGKINRYKNSLETFRKHYDEISDENIDMIESAFATLIGEQV